MPRKNNGMHEHIVNFSPDVTSLEVAHQDFFSELSCFNAGSSYVKFNIFLVDEAEEYKNDGDGVTYVVWNVFYDEVGTETRREIVAFYTLSVTAIPYEDRIRLDEEEARETGREFDTQLCGIPALEIKMFALDENYQDKFYEFEGEDLPISAWIMRSIIDNVNDILNNVVGLKALFLHSLPNAEKFYEENGFKSMQINMHPFNSIDSEYRAMYLALREVHMNYDD